MPEKIFHVNHRKSMKFTSIIRIVKLKLIIFVRPSARVLENSQYTIATFVWLTNTLLIAKERDSGLESITVKQGLF